MDHKLLIRSMSKDERESLAARMKTSAAYLGTLAYSDKMPSLPMAARLERHTNGATTRQEIFPELLGDLINPLIPDSHAIFPVFNITTKIKSAGGVRVRCAGSFVLVDLPSGDTIVLSGDDGAQLSKCLDRTVARFLAANQQTMARITAFEEPLKRAS